MPEPLDPRRLQISLAQTLQLFPGHAGIVAKNPSSGSWQIRLLNQRVRLSIGKSRNPGPFAKDWKDERHPGIQFSPNLLRPYEVSVQDLMVGS
jgi:hypothetical protein